MDQLITYIIIVLIGYICGSIPFGFILTKLFGYGDIRQMGSGNIGATNALRTGNKLLAFLTLLLDIFKAALPVFIVVFTAGASFDQPQDIYHIYLNGLICGFGAILGHCYPVWLKFKGGKGVATAFGVLLAAVPFAGLLAAITWIMSAMGARMSSLASLSAMIAAPAYTYAFYGLYPALVNLAISAVVIWRHKDNINRIRTGTEPRIGSK